MALIRWSDQGRGMNYTIFIPVSCLLALPHRCFLRLSANRIILHFFDGDEHRRMNSVHGCRDLFICSVVMIALVRLARWGLHASLGVSEHRDDSAHAGAHRPEPTRLSRPSPLGPSSPVAAGPSNQRMRTSAPRDLRARSKVTSFTQATEAKARK